jgi:hypothetical protein
VLGLVAALRLNGQMMLLLLALGEGGLGGRTLRDRRADMAGVWCGYAAEVPGVAGGDWLRYIDDGRDGEARGTMSLGSGKPAE